MTHTISRRNLVWGGLLVVLSTANAAAQTNLVTNGSFENNYANWTAGGNQGIATSDPAYPASAGTRVVVLNANDQSPTATLSQSFNTTVGQRYALTFDAGTVGATSDQHLRVTLTGSGTIVDRELVFGGPTASPLYVPQRIMFVANSAQTTLSFADMSPSHFFIDGLLDNVQVVAESSSLPTITGDPVRTVTGVGGSATFSVVASGGTLSYQWQFNGANIAGATSSSYTVTSANATKAGAYRVRVTNSTGSVLSSAATLAVVPAGILLNGSFEYGAVGWTLSNRNVDVTMNTAYAFSDGSQLMHFDFGQRPSNGSISQTFATVPGTQYILTFDVGAMSFSNQDVMSTLVTVRGNTTLLSQSLSIAASGSGTLYQPQTFNFVADSASTTLTFADTSATTFDVDLVLDNVHVELWGNPPTITSQPQSQTVTQGSPASFSVNATGAGTLSYQWRFGGQPIAGATSSSYSIPSAQPSNAGSYDVVVSNSFGSTTSTAATLTVQTVQVGAFTNGSFESDYTAWTHTGSQQIVLNGAFGSSTSDGSKAVVFNAGQNTPNGVLSQTFATTSGQTYTLTFDLGVFSLSNQNTQRMQVTVQGGSTLLNQSVSITASGNGQKYMPQTFTVVANSATTTLTFQDTSTTTTDIDLFLDNVRVTSSTATGPQITSQPQSLTVTQGSQATFNVTATGTAPLAYQWRFGGQPIAGATSSSYSIASAQPANAGSYDVVVSNSVNSVTSTTATLTVQTVQVGAFTNGSFESDYTAWTHTGNQQIVLNGAFGSSTSDGSKAVVFNAGQNTPNGVLSQTFATTSDQTYTLTFDLGVFSLSNQNTQRIQVTVQGASALINQSVSITASGNGQKYVPQTFTFVANSATTTLTFQDTSTTTTDIDLFLDNVRVGSVTATGPQITSQPQSLTATQGSPATFNVTATGTAPLAYQWRFGGQPIAGATSSSYTIASAQAANAGSYDVVVSNSVNSVTSTTATLIVQTVQVGAFTNGSFESDYTAWTHTGSQQIVLNGAFGSSTSDGNKAVVFNAGQQTPSGVLSQTFVTTSGQTYTLTFDLGVFSLSNQNTQRMQVTVQGGSSTLLNQSLSITSSGVGQKYVPQTLSFVANGTTATLTFQDTSLTTTDLDLFLDNVRVTSSTAAGPQITSQPQSLTVTQGSPATFNVTATGTAPLSYQWRVGGQPITGATSSSYTIASAQPANAGSYDVVVSNSVNSVTSTAATLTVQTVQVGGFTNGSFESDYTAWTHTGNQQIVLNGAFGSSTSDGGKAVVFNAGQNTPNGVLSQTFATISGQTYNLTFDLGVFSLSNQDTQRMQVTVQGGSSTLLNQALSITASGVGQKYVPQTFSFVANGATSALTFQDTSLTTADLDLFLDNVRVTPVP